VKAQTTVLLFLANGFVSFYFWSEYQAGMLARRAIPEFLLSLIGINLAIALGRILAERSNRRKRSR